MEHRRGRPDEAGCVLDNLIWRLRNRFAPGGLLHYGRAVSR